MPHTPVYVAIPCPGNKHQQSIVTFRDHNIAAMLCVSCDRAWTEDGSHPALIHLPITDFRDVRRHGE